MRAGMSAVEVVIALIVVVVVLLPVIGLAQSQEREAYFLGFELMAQRRCRGLIDLVVTRNPVDVERASAGKFRPGADGMPEALIEVPKGHEGLGRIEWIPPGDAEAPTPAGGRLALFA